MKVSDPSRKSFVWDFDLHDGTGDPEIPGWVPPIYGKDISKLVSESKEFKQGATGAVKEAPTTREIAQGAGIAATDDDIPY